jgi:3-methyladenine DNA glycosylase AlkD
LAASKETRLTVQEIIDELKPLGSEGYRAILLNHGIVDPIYGIKIEYMKKVEKRIKKDYQLARGLYDTGIYDMMYLAGLIADDDMMTRDDLQKWAENAKSTGIREFTVPWVAAGSPFGFDMAREWINSNDPDIAGIGWATFSNLVALKNDNELDNAELTSLLQRIKESIHVQPNRLKEMMNNFVIAVGSYVAELTPFAIVIGEAIGIVTIDRGKTACKTPFSPDYIRKVEKAGKLGVKKKTVKC